MPDCIDFQLTLQAGVRVHLVPIDIHKMYQSIFNYNRHSVHVLDHIYLQLTLYCMYFQLTFLSGIILF